MSKPAFASYLCLDWAGIVVALTGVAVDILRTMTALWTGYVDPVRRSRLRMHGPSDNKGGTACLGLDDSVTVLVLLSSSGLAITIKCLDDRSGVLDVKSSYFLLYPDSTVNWKELSGLRNRIESVTFASIGNPRTPAFSFFPTHRRTDAQTSLFGSRFLLLLLALHFAFVHFRLRMYE